MVTSGKLDLSGLPTVQLNVHYFTMINVDLGPIKNPSGTSDSDYFGR